MYPARIAFYLAHELGHIALGHLAKDSAIVDFDSDKLSLGEDDSEENEADRFALQLLTGRSDPQVTTDARSYNAPGLARAVLSSARDLQIEPGTLALCFAYSTGNWGVVNSSMKFIYKRGGKPVWSEVNQIALDNLSIRVGLRLTPVRISVLWSGVCISHEGLGGQ